MRDDAIEQALVTGAFARELEELFGPAEYAELRRLAIEATKRGRRGGPKVLILPGIMGSKLGESVKVLGLFPMDDVYWLDPLDIVLGRIGRLALEGGSRAIKPLGVLLIAYARLKFRLRADGFDADFYAYDWRRSVGELGRDLKAHLDREPRTVSIVAHSMGGLVARAAVKAGASIERLVQLGSPNFGSFAPLLALRGVDDSVKKLAALDLAHDRSELINRVFRGFPGLIELLPSLPNDPGAKFFEPRNWPTDASKPAGSRFLAPSSALLAACSRVQDHLAPFDLDEHHWTLVAGVNQKTVTGAKFDAVKDEVVFESTSAGDGTVPLRFALVEGMPTYFVEESHGQLANHATVARAVADILDHGATEALSTVPPPERRAAPERISDAALRRQDPFADLAPAREIVEVRRPAKGVRGRLTSADLRGVIANFVGPGSARPTSPHSDVHAPERPADGRADPTTTWNRLVVGRARQHRLDIQLAHCSITQVSARAYVLGLFQGVAPSGAAAAIDRELEGAVNEFTRRRMFGGGVGEIHVLPANRSRMRTDMVLFAGLGFFDQFNDEVQRTASENVIRTFVRTHVEDFATVLFGGASGASVGQLLSNMLEGFVRGKLECDVDHEFRRVTLCEMDPDRHAEIRAELYRLASTPLFEDIEVTFSELPIPPAEEARVEVSTERSKVARVADPVYLIVRRERDAKGEIVFGSSLLTAGAKAAIVSDRKSVKTAQLEAQLAKTARDGFSRIAGRQVGTFLAQNVLGDSVLGLLSRLRDRHLVVVHDGPASRLPWETLRIGTFEPALSCGMSRRYMAENLSIAKYLDQRPLGSRLRLLLVVNPTGDLDGAKREGDRIHGFFKGRPDVQVRRLDGGQATKRALATELSTGRHDLVHYAGHAFFDPDVPERSGLLCAGEEPLTGVDLGALGSLPQLVFFNACESGRLRKRASRKSQTATARKLGAGERVAPAEAFLRGGVANFLGTYWPVGDDSAEAFSTKFYTRLLAGDSMGAAILAGRKAAFDEGSVDWSDYIHYGDHAFRVFT